MVTRKAPIREERLEKKLCREIFMSYLLSILLLRWVGFGSIEAFCILVVGLRT